MGDITLNTFLTKLSELSAEYLPKILLAVVTLLIGLQIIRAVVKQIDKQFKKNELDESLRGFLKSIIGWLFRVALFLGVASMVGVEITSFLAILGAAGLAIGLALQGSLANFAGGVIILLLKPYRAGDYVDMQGYSGTVKKIEIFHTTLNDVQNRVIILPNGAVANGNIKNFSKEKTSRVDIVVGIAYDADIRKAKDVLMEVVNSWEHTLKDPEPFIGVSELGDNSVNLVTRTWVKAENHWPTYFHLMEAFKYKLDENDIGIPFQQVDLHVVEDKTK